MKHFQSYNIHGDVENSRVFLLSLKYPLEIVKNDNTLRKKFSIYINIDESHSATVVFIFTSYIESIFNKYVFTYKFRVKIKANIRSEFARIGWEIFGPNTKYCT